MICKVCGIEFTQESRPGRNRLCCDECFKLPRDVRQGKVFDNTKPQTCAHCNKEFYWGRKKKYCSDECATEAINASRRQETKTLNCQVCGKEYESQRWDSKCCSKECSRKNKHRPHYGPIESITYICKHCGKEYHPKSKDRNTYCSRECFFADIKADPKIKPQPKPLITINCVVCGKEFKGKPNYKYCSDNCYKTYAHNEYLKYKSSNKYQMDLEKARANYKPVHPLTNKTCIHCGSEYKTRNMRQVCCSDKCTKSHAKRERRARKREQYVESVGLSYIYKRDKGICKLCGKKVSFDLVSPHPKSATLDHIVPLSLGGLHEKKNVQLAHMICNSLKGNSSMNEQLILFG